MKKTLASVVAMLLVLSTVLSLAACGKEKPVEFVGDFTYQDSVSTMASNWNPHTYQTNDDAYPADFLRVGLYGFIFNDELNPVEGKDPYAGYKIIPEMAASEPVDVTTKIKAEHPEFGIPENAEKGYAYTIDLNKDATWENGEKINADTYVYSMKQLLDPKLQNYRATDYMDSDLVIANAANYYYQGTTAYMDNGIKNQYAVADLTKNADGQYVTPDGNLMYIGLAYALDWTGGSTLKDYVGKYGAAYFDTTNWEKLVGMIDENGLIPLTDANYALFLPVITGNPAWGETEADALNYFVERKDYAPDYDFANVGCYKTGEYQITLVFGKSLAGFNLLYNLSSNWIVYEPYYEANKKQVGETDAWTSTYNTSVETTMSYGPYKLTQFQADKFMKFERNENWYGYTDGRHIYVDPSDGKTYNMYQTTAIECEVVAEAATSKLMFLKGELMTYGLQAEDFDTYRSSQYCHATPSETIFFLILNGYVDALNAREKNEGFDTTKYDLQSMTLLNFRKAVAVTYDRDLFAATVSPARSAGYGIIGTNYIYDPDTGAKYRDTDQAKKALCDFYSVDVSKYASLDEAVDSITGYDPVTAKELYKKAFDDAIAAGYITDSDKDGKSDQIVRIEYCISSDSDFMTKTINYLNEKMAEVTKDTPFDGKIEFVKSAPYGNDWSTKIREGQADTVLGGWSGSALNPFSLTDLYVNPSRAYDAKWFDATKINMTMTIDGKEITMTLKDWSDALNGADVNGYNFGDGMVDINTRLDILAAFETEVLKTYDYLPMLQDGGMSLLTQQCYYVVEEYNPIMGRGGIAYLKYNYNDADWATYVSEQGGELKY